MEEKMNEEELYDELDEEEVDENKQEKKPKTKKSKKTKKKKVKKVYKKRKPKKEIVYRDKGHPFITFILILIIIALALALAYVVYDNYYKKEEPVINETNNNQTTEEETSISESRALSIGNGLYNKVLNLYMGKGFTFDNEDTNECEEKNCTLITNYNEVLDFVFTENGKKAFEKNNQAIKKIDDKYYYIDGVSSNDKTNTELEIKNTDDNKMVFDVITTNEDKTEKKEFVIVKVNDNWLVEKFIY